MLAQKICAPGPLFFLLITATLFLSDSYSGVQLLSLPTTLYLARVACFIVIYPALGYTVYLYICTIKEPGFIPLRWFPPNKEDEKYLEYCRVCQGYKAHRAHHCRNCGRCVLKLDHHCGILNGCVGHRNDGKFAIFLCFEIIVLVYSLFLNMSFLYNAQAKAFVSSPAILPISVYARYLVTLGASTSVGVIFFAFCILSVHMKRLVRNRTYLEEIICDKAKKRRLTNKDLEPFVYPFDLGWKRNLHLTFRWNPVGDGYNWPVIEGCNQRSITTEHLQQKEENKRKQADDKLKSN